MREVSQVEQRDIGYKATGDIAPVAVIASSAPTDHDARLKAEIIPPDSAAIASGMAEGPASSAPAVSLHAAPPADAGPGAYGAAEGSKEQRMYDMTGQTGSYLYMAPEVG